MEELLPLIIHSLNLKDEGIRIICLKMIQKLLEKENTNTMNIEELTVNLVQSLKSKMSMQAKNSTLICLDLVLTTEEGGILKYKKQVTNEVKNFLDDRKRSTRRLAVKCINDWIIA